MRKIFPLIMAILFTGVASTYGQVKEETMKKGKKDQSELFNDLYISYGTGTIYYFIQNESLEAKTLSGTFLIGFSRTINKVIAVGFQLSYTNIGRSGTTYDYSYSTSYTDEMTDNLWQGIANVRFRYLNTPSFCMYSGIGMGVTMDYYTETYNNTTTKGQKLLPAGQLTLLGFRVGRALSFFGEFGIGTNSILNAGVSYKFAD
jgi:opacity protein-like surface antigen